MLNLRLSEVALAAIFASALGASARAEDGLPQEVLERVTRATVLVEVWYRPVGETGPVVGPNVGTGFVVSEDGLVITNHHCVDALWAYDPPAGNDLDEAERAAIRKLLVVSTIKVRLHSGKDGTRQFDAQLLATDDAPRDLALLRIFPGAPLDALPIADALLDKSLAPSVGLTQKVWAVGYPLGSEVEDVLEDLHMERNPKGLDLSIRDGSVSALRNDAAGHVKVVEHTCLIDHGNSGGPLVDVQGRVLGVNTWGVGKVGYAIPIDQVFRAFGPTLSLRGATTVKRAGTPGRRLIVEPAGKPGGSVFQTLREALAAAAAGDEVLIPAGSLDVDSSLTVPVGVWLHGAGTDKSALNFADKTTLSFGGNGYCELSDLTLHFEHTGARVGDGREDFVVDGTSSTQTFIHDVVLSGGMPRMRLSKGASPSLVLVEITTPFADAEFPCLAVDGAAGAPRLERCTFNYLTIRGASARVDGCSIEGLLRVSDGADPVVRGCRLRAMGPAVQVRSAAGTYSFNVLSNGIATPVGTQGPSVADADEKSKTTWKNNRVAAGSLRVGGEATIEGTDIVRPR